jgi:diaminohydroxyphosphoribosylaminopyrimidine deaminase/5-amino-6-(5-phosphoribosylamino)uracil reductase
MVDPNPQVAGRGVKWLKERGVFVETGFYQEELTLLNQAYIKFVKQGLPFITLKGALSLDGKIATRTGESFYITGEKARKKSMELRLEADAVLVGIETVLRDNPRLTIRLNSEKAKRKRFYRIVLDSQARLPLHSKLVKTAKNCPTLLATTERAAKARLAQLEKEGVEVAKFPSAGGRVDLVSLVEYLGKRNITHLLVEGGGQVNAAFFEAGLYDRVVIFLAPLLLGGESAPSWLRGEGVASLKDAPRLKVQHTAYLDDDLMLVGYPQGGGF